MAASSMVFTLHASSATPSRVTRCLGGSANRQSARALLRPRGPLASCSSPPAWISRATYTEQDDQKATESRGAANANAGRIVLESEEELRSTDQHRVVVGTATALMLGTFASGVSNLSNVGDYFGLGSGIVLAWLLSDLGSGIYHWAVDNYGSGETPVFGGQIAAFQGHHQRPWTITEREFCNNVHKVFGPARAPAAALFLVSLVHPGDVRLASLATFLFLVCMSQQFHAWSHMKKSELPAIVDAMQESGLLISRRDHGAHHKAPFDGNYCIVSGLWNPILDQDGADNGFFRSLERFFHKMTGVEPRCWLDELPEDWQELARPVEEAGGR